VDTLCAFWGERSFSQERMWKQIGKKGKIISFSLEGFSEFE
jgi:hypothetical protein